ncbi:SDR family oxidoreductase [Paenibacillus sp. F411]|uniref:SDR family oxidoreductase n=1 Tax=Paenibacillus sp. F411 TaxID=2820239 RepID=UPI001AAEFAAC|nr:SDR family oxidoreductase [Paenibacillus sp. F411]MBO2943835.1 SDR family oxidoreductase [Paenibacillus sp. F411]
MARNNKPADGVKPRSGKSALVTGASSGFGQLIALELASRGYEVMAGVRREEARAELMDLALAAGVETRIHAVLLDICLEEQVHAAVEEASDRWGRLDVLVNNAGEAVGGFVEELSLESWRRQFEVNVFGTISMTRAALPLLRKSEGAKLILMSSISGVIGFPGYGPYAASKFAVEGLGESLAMELEPFGIHVVLVEPGAYGTPIWDKGFRGIQPAAESPYREMLEDVLAFSSQTAGASGDPLEVAVQVGNIVDQKSPKLRYMLPSSSRWTLAAKRLLPHRLFRRLVLSAIRRSRK